MSSYPGPAAGPPEGRTPSDGNPAAPAPEQPDGWPPGQQPWPGAQPAWPGAGYYPPAPLPLRTNGLAIASMVCGIVWIYWVGSILALVFGYVARRQIQERGEVGAGMAVAGIVLGWIGVGTLVIVVVFGILASTGVFHG